MRVSARNLEVIAVVRRDAYCVILAFHNTTPHVGEVVISTDPKKTSNLLYSPQICGLDFDAVPFVDVGALEGVRGAL